MSETESTELRILPFLRKGLTAYVDDSPAEGAARASITLGMVFNTTSPDNAGTLTESAVDQPGVACHEDTTAGTVTVDKTFQLAGAIDVKSVSETAICRVCPAVGSEPMASTFMPYIEFYEADFPWRYTSAKPNPTLQPWLMLLACKDGEYREDFADGRRQLTVIAPDVLPATADLHLLAHAQRETKGGETVSELSRVLCNRPLEENTAYTAFLVPSFKLGLIGVGEGDASALDLAWKDGEPDRVHPFPIYYSWRFTTGEAAFRTLAERLNPLSDSEYAALRDTLRVDMTDVGLPYVHKAEARGTLSVIANAAADDDFGILPMGVAMKKTVGSDPQATAATQALVQAQTDALEDRLLLSPVFAQNEADKDETNNQQQILEEEDPWVVPPVYGGRHLLATRDQLKAHGQNVLRDLNLNMENRMAAGLGATVVQDHQEEFVHRAWQQVEEVNRQNSIVRELVAMHQNNQIAQRRVGATRQARLSAKQRPLASDAALRMTARSRLVGTGSLMQICSGEHTPDTINSTIMQRAEADLNAPVGISFDDLRKKVFNPNYWEDPANNRRLYKACPMEKYRNARTDDVWQAILPFSPLRRYLKAAIKTEGSGVDTTTAYRLEIIGRTKGEMERERQLALENNRDVRQPIGYGVHNPVFEWMMGDNTSVTPRQVREFAEYMKRRNSLDGMSVTCYKTDGATRTTAAVLPPAEYQMLRDAVTRETKDEAFRYESPRGFNPDEALFVGYAESRGEDENQFFAVYAAAAAGSLVEYYCDNVKLTYDGNGYFRPSAKKGSVYVNGEKYYFEYGGRRDPDDLLEGKMGKSALCKLSNIVDYIKDIADTGRMWVSYKQNNSLVITQIQLDDGKHFAMFSVPLHLTLSDIFCYGSDNAASVKALLADMLQCVKDIGCRMFVPTKAVVREPDECKPFTVMDYFGTNSFEDMREQYVERLSTLVTDGAEAYADDPSHSERVAAWQQLDSLVPVELEPEPEAAVDNWATEQAEQRLQTILQTYSDGGRTPEQLADRLVEIATMRHPIMVYPEYYDPTFFYLRQKDTRFVLPSANTLKMDSISVFESNPRFEEAFLAGMNTEMGRELLWREYPTDERGSYFRKFWDKEQLPDSVDDYYDVWEMHQWLAPLGCNHLADDGGAMYVFTIRGRLLRAYPNTRVYISRWGNNRFEQCELPEMSSWLDNDTFIVGYPKQRLDTLRADGTCWCLTFEEQGQGVSFFYGSEGERQSSAADSAQYASQHINTLTIWGYALDSIIK